MTIKTIKPSGGDFTTLSAWEASLAATLTVPQQADVYNFGSSGLVESGGVAFTGLTTTSVNRVIISSPVGQRHNGVAHSGAYVTCGASGSGGTIRTTCDYITIDWMEVEGLNGQNALLWGISSTAGNNQSLCQHSIIHSNTNTLSTNGSNTNYIYRNCFIYTSSNTRQFDSRGCTTCEVSNCTFLTQGTDLGLICDTEATIKNTYSGGCSSGDYWTGGAPAGSFNVSSDTTATNRFPTGSQNSKAASTVLVSATSGSEDLRMKTGTNALFDTGTTIAAVTDDIIGTTRPQGAAYDVGGFERVVSSGVTATGAWTETQDAWAGSVTLTFPTITANAAWTESRDAWAGSVTVAFPAITAAAVWTEAQDLWNGSATIALPAIIANGAWIEQQDIWRGDGGPPPLFVGDAHDPGWRKRRKQQEAQRLTDFQNEQALRARRRAQVIDALERIVEGKPRISEAAAEEIAQAIEAEQPAAPSFDFDAALKDINRVQAAWDAYLDRDDEDVLGLL